MSHIVVIIMLKCIEMTLFATSIISNFSKLWRDKTIW